MVDKVLAHGGMVLLHLDVQAPPGVRADFFFSSRRRHTRWTGDWSSDVCSSDLTSRLPPGRPDAPGAPAEHSYPNRQEAAPPPRSAQWGVDWRLLRRTQSARCARSEERRVGREWRCGGWPDQRKRTARSGCTRVG